MTNTIATLNGLFKEVYSDKIRNLLPQGVKLTRAFDFVARNKELGNAYHQPVVLAYEHGLTFSNPGDVGGAFALNNAVAGQMRDASVKSVEVLLRSRLSYVAASRAEKGRNAFVDATELLVRNMQASFAKKLEIEVLYGQSGLGAVATGGVTGQTITIAAGEWAPGIWAGSEGMFINITSADGLTVRNGGQSYSSTATANAYRIASVNIAAKTITVVGTMTGVVATDVIWFAGAQGNEGAGLHKILTNTGTLFNIDATQYNMWQGNIYPVTSATKALKVSHVYNAIDLAVAKGLDEDVTLWVSIKAFSDLQYDAEQKRMIDSSYNGDKQVRGSKEFGFLSQNGAVTVKPSIYVKEGYAYITVNSDFTRIGSTDITFNRPGQTDSFFLDLQDNAGYELRAYTDQTLFCEAPGRQAIITGLVPGDYGV